VYAAISSLLTMLIFCVVTAIRGRKIADILMRNAKIKVAQNQIRKMTKGVK
jgi:hypothetical protein